jgi:hypothetical protein
MKVAKSPEAFPTSQPQGQRVFTLFLLKDNPVDPVNPVK